MATPVEPAAPPTSGATPQKVPARGPVKRRWLLIILALTFLFVLMPFLFWQATWFGRPLDDAQLRKALVDNEHPREIQHALSQIADRILATDPAARASARPFYSDVVRVARTGGDELRLTAAWVMGQDNAVPEFHTELLQLLQDSNPMVRRNAALALVRFSDPAGRDEIRSMLRPYPVDAAQGGVLNQRLKPGDSINPGTLLAHVAAGGKNIEMRSQVPGTINRWLVSDGATISPGQPVLLVDPSTAEVWEALRALYLIGEQQDLPSVEQFIRGGESVPNTIRQQAQLTAQAIQSREKQ